MVRKSLQPLSLDAETLADAGTFVRGLGLALDEVTPTRVVGRLELGEQHHTPWGIVHGGAYSTAIETAASIGASAAALEHGQVAVGLTNTTHFLRPVTGGSVTIDAKALNQGRSQQLWQVDVMDTSGRLVAHGEVRLQNMSPRPEEDSRPNVGG